RSLVQCFRLGQVQARRSPELDSGQRGDDDDREPMRAHAMQSAFGGPCFNSGYPLEQSVLTCGSVKAEAVSSAVRCRSKCRKLGADDRISPCEDRKPVSVIDLQDYGRDITCESKRWETAER